MKSKDTCVAPARLDHASDAAVPRERLDSHGEVQADSSNNSRPISMRRISLVPAPIS
jgi:hypothetical protein